MPDVKAGIVCFFVQGRFAVKYYDTVVIGSGISGLTSARLLSLRRGDKVLLLEQHFKLGGFTHTFRRKHYEWDVGLHYVGGMQEGAFLRKIMDCLTQGRVQWQKMPDPFEKYLFPTLTVAQRSGLHAFQSDLLAAFPKDNKAIDAYFVGLRRAEWWAHCWMAHKMLPRYLAWIPRLLAFRDRRFGRMTLQQFLDGLTKNARLAAVLSAQCGDYGLLPDKASLFIHAMVVMHYQDGGYYPVGGSRVVGSEIAESLRSKNVDIRLNHEVEEILVKGGRVWGVKVRDKRAKQQDVSIINCRKVISTVGAKQTYLRLLSPSVEIAFREELRDMPTGLSMVGVYVGFRSSPANLGFSGENVWIFDSYDLNAIQRDTEKLPEGKIRICYATFPTLKSSDHRRSGARHTAELLVPALYETFAPWAKQRWRKRDAEYEELKRRIGGYILDFVDSRFPGFKDAVDYFEVSTPLSFEHFSRHERGEVYGLPATVERLQMKWLGPRTPVKGLYLGGADALSHGVMGAMLGGFAAVVAAQGPLGALQVARAIALPSGHPQDR